MGWVTYWFLQVNPPYYNTSEVYLSLSLGRVMLQEALTFFRSSLIFHGLSTQDSIWLRGGRRLRGGENLPCAHGRFSKKKVFFFGLIRIIASWVNTHTHKLTNKSWPIPTIIPLCPVVARAAVSFALSPSPLPLFLPLNAHHTLCHSHCPWCCHQSPLPSSSPSPSS